MYLGNSIALGFTYSGQVGISKVEFFEGATKISEDSDPPYTCNYRPSTLGNHYVTSKTVNIYGTNGRSTIFIVVNSLPVLVLPNIAPTVNITSPVNGANIIAKSNSFNNIISASVVITASASDRDGTISKVEFYNGTKLLGSDTIAPYSFKFVGTAGTYPITAKAYDNKGAVTTSSVVSIRITNSSTAKLKSTDDEDIQEEPIAIKMFPNPFKNTFNISLPASDDAYQINIINENGQTVESATFNNENTYQAGSNLTPGMYFVTVKNGATQSTTKMVKF